MQDFVGLLLEVSIELFFLPFLFPNFCCSVCTNVVCAVTGRCNKSFFALFNVVLEFLYWYIHAIFNAGESSSAYFGFELFSRSPEILFLNIFIHLHFFLWCPLPISPSTCKFPFLHTFWSFSWFNSSIPSVICLSHFSLWHIFLCKISSLYPYCIFLTFILGFPILFILLLLLLRFTFEFLRS